MNRSGVAFYLGLSSAVVAGWATGCDAPQIKPSLADDDPSVKIPAMKLAVKQHDLSAVPILIKNLESEDPAVRFYADDALRKITAQDFGFVYFADEDVRQPAVQRWRTWLSACSQPATDATSAP